MDATRQYVDEVFCMFVEVFINKSALQLDDGTVMNLGNVHNKAFYYVLSVVRSQNMQMAINYGEDYEVTAFVSNVTEFSNIKIWIIYSLPNSHKVYCIPRAHPMRNNQTGSICILIPRHVC